LQGHEFIDVETRSIQSQTRDLSTIADQQRAALNAVTISSQRYGHQATEAGKQMQMMMTMMQEHITTPTELTAAL